MIPLWRILAVILTVLTFIRSRKQDGKHVGDIKEIA